MTKGLTPCLHRPQCGLLIESHTDDGSDVDAHDTSVSGRKLNCFSCGTEE